MQPILTKFFIIVVLTIFAVLLLMTFIPILVHMAFAQGTPTTTTTQELTSPNPNLQYIPQKAFIVPLGPNGQVQAIPIQESSSAGVDGNLMGTLAGLSGVGAAIWAKISGKKELEKEITPVKEVVKDNTVAIVQSKEVEQGITKTMFELAPAEKVAAMEGTAPAIKLKKLQDNKDEAIETAAKAPT